MILRIFLVLFATTGIARADAPRVVTDIAPVHSLVEWVMLDVGGATLLVEPGTSPHDAALKPSQAQVLSEAGLVVWMGPSLTPAMAESVDALATQAVQLDLLTVEGTKLLPLREGEDGHDHDHDHDHEDGMDPHAWLDPVNAAVWVGAIAEALVVLDPEHAETYRRNADAARQTLMAGTEQITQQLAPYGASPFVVYHDAFQYFEHRFDLVTAGSIATSEAAAPGPARLAAMRGEIREGDVLCVFAEPQMPRALIDAAIEGSSARVSVLDPLGADIEPGPGLYIAMISALSSGISDCLQGGA